MSDEAGIRFRHTNGATDLKYMPETMGSGGLFFDYDRDGAADIFLVDGGSLVDREVARQAHSVLYRNNRDGTFRDVTREAGLAARAYAYGMGACAADYDNDGWVDLYLTNYGPDALLRNNGDGSFSDVTQGADLGSTLWGTSCAFGDIENDGDVDLFVANYVDFSLLNNKHCGNRDHRAYCHPQSYNGLRDHLYRNNGDGTFTDISREAGVLTSAGNGLGVLFGDYDDDGWIDIYVANDSVPNFLYQNQGDGTFVDVASRVGVSVNGEGKPEAGMGIDLGDVDGDGHPDIFVTNLDGETNTLYRSTGDGLFEDFTFESGHGWPSLSFVGFGAAFFDYDNDADLDVIVANGHILDNARIFGPTEYRQLNLLFRNDGGGTFLEVGGAAGPGLALEKPSRGLAVADFDDDGDLDVLITNTAESADLLRNDGQHHGNALFIRTVGTASNRDGIGSRLRLTIGATTQLREVRAGSSYLGQNDLRVHFGLGAAGEADRLEVLWPSGTVDVMEDVRANQVLTVVEGKAIVERESLGRRDPAPSEP